MASGAGTDLSSEESDEGEFDLQRAMAIAAHLARAPRRQPRVAALSALLTLVLGIAVTTLWPRSYVSYSRILAQHNSVLPALGNPTRAIPHEAELPTKNAADQ